MLTRQAALRFFASSLKGKGRAIFPVLAGKFADLPIERFQNTNASICTDAVPRQTSSQSVRCITSSATMSNLATASTTASSSATTLQSSPLDPNAISLLRSQPLHYVIASIAGRTLLLHPHDLVTLPRLNDLEIGDIIELDRIHEVGSRDYTLRAQDPMNTRSRGVISTISTNTHQVGLLEMLREVAKDADGETLSGIISDDGNVKESQSWAAKLKPGGLAHVGSVLNTDTVRVRCTVVEHTKGRMEFIVKTKRRKGYKKTIRHKQTYTRLRVEGIQLGPQTI